MTCEAERFTAANIPPLRGYVVIVTGGKSHMPGLAVLY